MFRTLFLSSVVMMALTSLATGETISNEKVIVAFGDSTTAVRNTVPKVYADLLQERLPALLGQAVTVYNAGIGGNQTSDALARLNTDVRSRNPDIAIVQFGINDSWVYSGHQGEPSAVAIDAATQATSPYASRGNFTDNLTSIIRTLKSDGCRVILMTPNQLQIAGPGAEMPWRNDLLGRYAEVVRQVAASERTELLDVWTMYSDYAAVAGHSVNDLLVDSQHPGQLGHQMVADRLVAMLVPVPEPASVGQVVIPGLLLLGLRMGHRRGADDCFHLSLDQD